MEDIRVRTMPQAVQVAMESTAPQVVLVRRVQRTEVQPDGTRIETTEEFGIPAERPVYTTPRQSSPVCGAYSPTKPAMFVTTETEYEGPAGEE